MDNPKIPEDFTERLTKEYVNKSDKLYFYSLETIQDQVEKYYENDEHISVKDKAGMVIDIMDSMEHETSGMHINMDMLLFTPEQLQKYIYHKYTFAKFDRIMEALGYETQSRD